MKDEILKWRRNFGSSTALQMSLSKLFEQPSRNFNQDRNFVQGQHFNQGHNFNQVVNYNKNPYFNQKLNYDAGYN